MQKHIFQAKSLKNLSLLKLKSYLKEIFLWKILTNQTYKKSFKPILILMGLGKVKVPYFTIKIQ